jgi:CheY-like chemotaxis protein
VPTQPRLLVVDDDPNIREILLAAFDDEGYEVRAAQHGQAALAALGEWQPDLIVFDLMMPVMDGWTFRARQLENPAWAHIPVVVLSAVSNWEARMNGLKAQAFFSKPFKLDDLLDTISELVH